MLFSEETEDGCYDVAEIKDKNRSVKSIPNAVKIHKWYILVKNKE